MAENKLGRKTSPGFADPMGPVSVAGQDRITPDRITPDRITPGIARATVPVSPVQAAPVVVAQHPAPVPAPVPLSAATPQPVPEPKPQAAPADPSTRARSAPLVEVEVIHERGRAPRSEPLRRCYEVWTQNTVYVIDSRMRCIEVRSASSNETRSDHPFLDARLVGGQLQRKDSIEMSYPLPRPGSFAVFESRKGNRRNFSRTSSVERVVLRLRIVTITDGNQVPSWDDLLDD